MSRQQRRKHKKPASGPVKPVHKRQAKEKQMNAGGYYEGMPGCTLDEYGNRKMLEFITRPDGTSTTLIHAHPKFVKACVQGAMSNPMIKGVINSAVLDNVFSKKTPWNWILRTRLRLNLKRYHKKMNRKADKLKEKIREDEQTQIH